MENFLWAKIGTYLGRLKSDFGTLQEYKRTLSKSAKSLQLSTNWKYNFRSESSANLGKCNSLWAVGWQEIEKGRCCRHCSLANVALPTEDRPPGKQIHLCAKILRKYMFKKLFLIHHQLFFKLLFYKVYYKKIRSKVFQILMKIFISMFYYVKLLVIKYI